jgi:tRNA nucleotidyltransferase/poly(A) polymerase
VVSFTDDWVEDAARRDFTINAMYCDAVGKIYDFTEGYADIRKRKVKFVGTASQRIKEDYLRILRFFRFHAWYGKSVPDEAGFKACVRLKSGLKTLSAERVRQEILKLIVAPQAVKTLKLIASSGILKTIIPHTDEWRVLERLPADAVLRLFILARHPDSLKERLRLSNADGKRLEALHFAPDLSPALTEVERRRILYHIGVAAWRDSVLLSHARSLAKLDDKDWLSLLNLVQHWTPPCMPIKGADLIEFGMAAGPQLGRTLAALEDWWVASDFEPTRTDLLARVGRYNE